MSAQPLLLEARTVNIGPVVSPNWQSRSGSAGFGTDYREGEKSHMAKLLTSIADFEARHHGFTAQTADDASEWISTRHVDYEINPVKISGNGPFVTLAQADVDDMSLVAYRWNAELQSTSLADSNRLCICLPLAGQAQTVDQHFGLLAPTPNQARIFRRDAGTEHVSASEYVSVLTFMLPADALEKRAQSYYHESLNEPLRFSPLLDLRSESGRSLIGLIDHIQIQLGRTPEALDSPVVRANLREYVFATFLGCLPHNYNDTPLSNVHCGTPVTVRRAEEFMHTHADLPITMEMLAREAGCSERALQNAFRKFRESTPMMVLREIRLEYARQDLIDMSSTVTDIALKWGFSNLGRFAMQYGERFGEKPSDTRRMNHAESG